MNADSGLLFRGEQANGRKRIDVYSLAGVDIEKRVARLMKDSWR